MQHVTVCVTCIGGRLIYDIIHGLRMTEGLNVRVVGVDVDPEAHGRLHCDVFATVPKAEGAEEAYIQRLEQLHQQTGFDVLLLLSEGEARAAALFRDRLIARGIRLSVSPHDVVATMTDKLLMMQRAADCGVDVGPFYAVDSRQAAEEALVKLGYPKRRIVLKTRRGAGSRGVVILDASEAAWKLLLPNRFCGTGSSDAAFAAMAANGMDFSDLIAVPYIDGPVYDVDCIARNGELIDVAARLRQLRNPLWPTSTGHKIDLHPEVLRLARRLCAAYGVQGAADFDIALDESGKSALFDAAARFSGSVGGSLTAGANFPGRLVRHLLDLPNSPLEIRNGVVLRPYLTMTEIPSHNEKDYL